MKQKLSNEHNIEHNRSKMRVLQHTIIGKPTIQSYCLVPNYAKLVFKIIICDQACENRAYLHMKFDLIFQLQLTISFKVQMLLQ